MIHFKYKVGEKFRCSGEMSSSRTAASWFSSIRMVLTHIHGGGAETEQRGERERTWRGRGRDRKREERDGWLWGLEDLTDLAGGLAFAPNTHLATHSCLCNCSNRGSNAFFWPFQAPLHIWYTNSCAQAHACVHTQTYTNTHTYTPPHTHNF